MDPRAGRRIALLAIAAPIVLAAASTLLITHGARAPFPSGRTAAGAAVGHVDAPLAVIACEELPVKKPDPDEAARDEATRPYQLLVRTFVFPSLAPIDVDLARLVVYGAESSRRVGTGEYLFERISVGYTSASLLAPQDAGAPRRSNVDGRLERIAERNPVVLARHARTTCDLFVFGPEDLAWSCALHGTVEEPGSKRPLAGARVACGTQSVRADEQGRFEFAAPVSWGDLSKETVVTCDGYEPFLPRAPSMPPSWIRAVVERHEAIFWLRPAGGDAARPLVPALPR